MVVIELLPWNDDVITDIINVLWCHQHCIYWSQSPEQSVLMLTSSLKTWYCVIIDPCFCFKPQISHGHSLTWQFKMAAILDSHIKGVGGVNQIVIFCAFFMESLKKAENHFSNDSASWQIIFNGYLVETVHLVNEKIW